jgi:hypothetical protein
MRNLILIAVLTCTAYTAKAAYFSHYDGGLYAYGQVNAEDAADQDGAYYDSNETTAYSSVETYAEVPNAYSYTSSAIWDSNDAQSRSLCLRINSFAEALNDDETGDTYSYGYGSTEDSNTYGIFFEITPEPAEDYNDDVVVYITTTIKAAAWGQTYAYIGGPSDANFIAVTLNQLPPVADQPDPEKTVWLMDNLELYNESFDGYVKTFSFRAKTGDIIAIFAESYTEVSGDAPLDGLIETDLTIILTAQTILPGDLDDDLDVDFLDFAIFADNWLKTAENDPLPASSEMKTGL